MINLGLITHEAIVELGVGDQRELLVFDITNTGRYSCILGTPWLVRHDPTIQWARKEVIFDSEYCQEACRLQREGTQEAAASSDNRGHGCQCSLAEQGVTTGSPTIGSQHRPKSGVKWKTSSQAPIRVGSI